MAIEVTHVSRVLPEDDEGRMVLGNPRGCPHCRSVQRFVSANGRAVVYVLPKRCCAPRAADLRARGA